MAKDKRPRKSTKPARRRKAAGGPKPEHAEPAPAALVPAPRRAAAVRDVAVPDRLLRLLRTALGRLLDVADVAAGAITQRRKGPTP
jgi:hypothetical protein